MRLTELIESVSAGCSWRSRARHTLRAVEARQEQGRPAGTVYRSRHAAATGQAEPADVDIVNSDRPAPPAASRLRISPAVQAATGCRLCGARVDAGWCTSAVCGAAQ